MTREVEILVVGGGVAGLTASAALAAAGREVLCVDLAPEGAGLKDTRTTAFLRPAAALLDEAGIRPLVERETAPLTLMRLIDAGGRENRERERSEFDAAEVGEPPFGWNVPNAAMRRALTARLAALGVEMRNGVGLEALTLRRDEALARLTDGSALRARLVVAADGRDSRARALAGIGARRWAYGQKALVFTVTHEAPHEGVSTEIHRTGGPFTLAPLPDGPGGEPRSAVIWMERAAEAERLLALEDDAFGAAANERSLGVLGALKPVSPRAAWPIVSLLADRLTAPRLALIAEAAHVVPPIGAQGLNMSLADLAALRAAMEGDPGAAAALRGYARRWPELAARVAGIDALNRAAMAEARPLRDLRRLGLAALTRATPARRLAMRLGMGLR